MAGALKEIGSLAAGSVRMVSIVFGFPSVCLKVGLDPVEALLPEIVNRDFGVVSSVRRRGSNGRGVLNTKLSADSCKGEIIGDLGGVSRTALIIGVMMGSRMGSCGLFITSSKVIVWLLLTSNGSLKAETCGVLFSRSTFRGSMSLNFKVRAEGLFLSRGRLIRNIINTVLSQRFSAFSSFNTLNVFNLLSFQFFQLFADSFFQL